MDRPAFPAVAEALRKGLGTVEALLPLAAVGGPMASSIAAITGTLIDIGQSALDAGEAGFIAYSSNDEATVKQALADLRAKNDELAKKIAES